MIDNTRSYNGWRYKCTVAVTWEDMKACSNTVPQNVIKPTRKLQYFHQNSTFMFCVFLSYYLFFYNKDVGMLLFGYAIALLRLFLGLADNY